MPDIAKLLRDGVPAGVRKDERQRGLSFIVRGSSQAVIDDYVGRLGEEVGRPVVPFDCAKEYRLLGEQKGAFERVLDEAAASQGLVYVQNLPSEREPFQEYAIPLLRALDEDAYDVVIGVTGDVMPCVGLMHGPRKNVYVG
ncbi:MAG: hypothetical protein ACLFO2_01210 [Candidatus Woesearchaeota archaeon]